MKSVLAAFGVSITVFFISVSVVASSFGISTLYKILGLQEANLDLVYETSQFLSVTQNIPSSTQYLSSLLDHSGQPLYSADEISHLIDVKFRFDIFRMIGLFSLVYVLIFVVYLLKRKKIDELRLILLNGYKVTLFFQVFTLIFIMIFWDQFFILFHEIIFPHGNWSFPIESWLIQLFPEKFWFGFGLSIVCSALILSLCIYYFSKLCYNKPSFEQ